MADHGIEGRSNGKAGRNRKKPSRDFGREREGKERGLERQIQPQEKGITMTMDNEGMAELLQVHWETLDDAAASLCIARNVVQTIAGFDYMTKRRNEAETMAVLLEWLESTLDTVSRELTAMATCESGLRDALRENDNTQAA